MTSVAPLDRAGDLRRIARRPRSDLPKLLRRPAVVTPTAQRAVLPRPQMGGEVSDLRAGDDDRPVQPAALLPRRRRTDPALRRSVSGVAAAYRAWSGQTTEAVTDRKLAVGLRLLEPVLPHPSPTAEACGPVYAMWSVRWAGPRSVLHLLQITTGATSPTGGTPISRLNHLPRHHESSSPAKLLSRLDEASDERAVSV